jgi:hypothetical protein
MSSKNLKKKISGLSALKFFLLFFLIAGATTAKSQIIAGWQQYYSNPSYGFDFGNDLAIVGPEELFLVDKATFNVSSFPFPPEFRDVNSHNNQLGYTRYGHGVILGPDSTLILRGGRLDNRYEFDGTSWKLIEKFGSHDIEDVWFSYNKNGYNVFGQSDSSFNITGNGINKKFPYNSTPYGIRIYSVEVSKDAHIFFTHNYQVSIYDGTEWLIYDTATFKTRSLGTYITSEFQNNFCFAHYGTLHSFNDELKSWRIDSIPQDLYHTVNGVTGRIVGINYDDVGNLWISGYGVFAKFDGKNFTDYYTNQTPAVLNFIKSDFPGKLFSSFNSEFQIFDIETEEFSRLKFPNAVLGNGGADIKASLQDTQGQIWFANGHGNTLQDVIRYDKGIWEGYNINSQTNSMFKDTGKGVLVTSTAGLIFRVTDTGVTNITSSSNSDVLTTGSIGIDSDDHYWFGSKSSTLRDTFFLVDYHNGIGVKHTNPSVQTLPIEKVYVDSNDTKWVHQTIRLFSFKKGQWSEFKVSNSPYQHRNIYHITEQPGTNILWFSTDDGFLKNDHGAWSVVDATNSPLPSSIGQYVYFDQSGRQWFGTREGVAVLDDGNWEVYTTANSALRNNDVQCIVEDNECNIWFGTEYGLSKAIMNCPENLTKLYEGTVYSPDESPREATLVEVVRINNKGNDIVIVDNQLTDSNGNFSFYLEDDFEYYFSAKINPRTDNDILTSYPSEKRTIQEADFENLNSPTQQNIDIYQQEAVRDAGSFNLRGNIFSRSERISNMRIILTKDGESLQETKTNMYGQFVFKNLNESNYHIWVDKPNLNNKIAPTVYVSTSKDNYQFELTASQLKLTNNFSSILNENSVTCYPNPFGNSINFTVRAVADMRTKFKIYDYSGQLVSEDVRFLQYGMNNISLDTKALPQGIYFYYIHMDGVNHTGKVIKD